MSLGARHALKIYSGILGFLVCLFAFVWVAFQLYLINETHESQNDLLMARYLDICFGCLAFFSSLALMYGSFVESKTWITAWILGSLLVVVGMWAWYCYKKYSRTPHPEVVTDFENAGIVLSVLYIGSTLPICLFLRKIQHWDIDSLCNLQTLTWLCPGVFVNMMRSSRPFQAHQQHQRSSCLNNGQAPRRSHYLPTYAQCTTNTFTAPSHTHVSHIPASKGESLKRGRRPSQACELTFDSNFAKKMVYVHFSKKKFSPRSIFRRVRGQ